MRTKTHGHDRGHGGGLDRAVQEFGGPREDWLDLSTGINPAPYPPTALTQSDWSALPDAGAMLRLLTAARKFWAIPAGADILAGPGASALIARLPGLQKKATVQIMAPTYNEHAASFRAAGWTVTQSPAATCVTVHPNNPTGQLWDGKGALASARNLLVIDESFCDVMPDQSHIRLAESPGVIILKSFGKFWGLAGLRLGFAIGRDETLAGLRDMIGPWPVSGPALRIGTAALADLDWARRTRDRLTHDAARLDTLLARHGAKVVGGTTLFRLYAVADAPKTHMNMARKHILTRIFPYSRNWLRLGLPGNSESWARLEAALAEAL